MWFVDCCKTNCELGVLMAGLSFCEPLRAPQRCGMVELPKVSIILPSYNEAENIVPLVRALRGSVTVPHEILVMDDDSRDGTGYLAQKVFAEDSCVTVHIRQGHPGLANSIREGIERGRGEKVLVMVTNFKHDPALTPLLLHVSECADIVMGSRFCAGGNMEYKLRYVLSLVYNWFIRLVLRTQVQDNLFGYFIMEREKLMKLPLDRIFYGYGDYFFRLLWYGQHQGYSIIEIPAFCRSIQGDEVKWHNVKVFVRYTREVLRLWMVAMRHRRGRKRGSGPAVTSPRS